MNYRGYEAVVRYDEAARLFHGEVVNTRDVITFEGRSVEEIEEAFHGSVDDYLEFCAVRHREPEKPFSGKTMIRIPPALHAAIAVAAARQGISINAWIAENLDRVIQDRGVATTEERERRTPARSRAAGRKPSGRKARRAVTRTTRVRRS